ncbi:MAG: gamma-glutamylcyclotransferase family protein [Patescibacteria group bacterium]
MQEYLFVYGTLRDAEVQKRVVGRLMPGEPDTLEGYGKSIITLGKRTYPIISPQDGSVIEGEVLTLTLEELEKTDEYETSAYTRQKVTLQSGKTAWVYIKNPKQ